MATPRKRILLPRKVLFYGGMPLIALGVLLFLHASVAFTARFVHFVSLMREERTEGAEALGGMLLMLLGSFLMHLGARVSPAQKAARQSATRRDGPPISRKLP